MNIAKVELLDEKGFLYETIWVRRFTVNMMVNRINGEREIDLNGIVIEPIDFTQPTGWDEW